MRAQELCHACQVPLMTAAPTEVAVERPVLPDWLWGGGRRGRGSSVPTPTKRKHQTVGVKERQRSDSQALRGPERTMRLTQNVTMLLGPEAHAGEKCIYITESWCGSQSAWKPFSTFVWMRPKYCEASGNLWSVWSKVTSISPFFSGSRTCVHKSYRCARLWP